MSKNKKPLLNEGTVRRMMRLAEIDSLSDNFVQETYIAEEEELEEGVEEEIEEAAHEDDKDGGMMADDEPADETPEVDVDAMDMGGDDGEVSIDKDAAEVLIALGKDLEGALGDEAEEEAEEEGEMDLDEPGMGGYGRVDKMMDESETDDSLYESALKGLDIELVEEDENTTSPETLEEVKKEVYKRVIQRLIKESKQ